MAIISFKGKSNKLTDLEIYNGVISGNTGVMSRFYREQRIPFEQSIVSVYGTSYIGKVITVDDIYSISFTRLLDMFQRKSFAIDGEKILYKKRGAEDYSPLSGSIANFLNSIGKNVYKEIIRDEAPIIESDIEKLEGDDSQDNVEECNSSSDNDDITTPKGDVIDDSEEIASAKIKNTILVWKIVDNMQEPCKTILDQSLTKHLTGKTDEDIAIELGYKNSDIVKANRTRCKSKFKEAFLKHSKL